MTEPRTPGQRLGVHQRTGDVIPPVQEYVEYHWHRIFTALAVVVILIAGAVYGVRAWLGESEHSPEDMPDTAAAPATPEELPAVDEPALSAPLPMAESEPEPVPTPLVPQYTVAVETIAPELSPTGEASGTSGSSDVPATVPPKETEPGTEAPAEGDRAVPVSAPALVEIRAPGLTRAQLTLELEDKEPVGLMPGQLAMNDQGLLRVYLFTETRGLKDQSHFHDWYLNGQRVARVRIRPYANEMRASSSKFIDRNMTGDWRVEVVMANGEPLATGAFVVTP